MKITKTNIFKRKDEHIKFVLNNKVEGTSNLLECVQLIHTALPEMDLNEVDLSTSFLGKDISFPLIISPLTGGTSQGRDFNEILASMAQKYNIPMMVGSQRIILKHPETVHTFSIARKCAPDIPIVANIGIPQLKEKDNSSEIERILKTIEADALAIHLNSLQEVVQPEGEPLFLRGIEKIIDVLSGLKIPLIIRETGGGISKEIVQKLLDIGIKIIDVSGVGGTSWSAVEFYRSKSINHHIKAELGKTFWNWGIPTAASILEVRTVAKNFENVTIIASGGIRTGLDIAKSLILGADIAGSAQPFLKVLKKPSKYLDNLIIKLREELRVSLFLTGSRTIQDFKGKPKIIFPPLKIWKKERDL